MGGLGYIAGVAIENMEALDAPLLGASTADIRAAYAGDHALLLVTAGAGAVSLAFYCLFVVGLVRFLRPEGRWRVALLAGGLGGPLVAAGGQVARAVLIERRGSGMSETTLRTLFDVHLLTQLAAAWFLVLFLVGVAVCARRSGRLPGWVAWSALVAAVPIALGPVAGLTESHALQVVVAMGYGADALWVLATSLWLALAIEASASAIVRRAAFLLLVIAAGLVGLGLVIAPGSAETFFSWGLAPDPLAAFAGGVYVGSAALYAIALAREGPASRGLVVGAAVLSVSVFAVTLVHLDIFDFDRLQAWAWVVLFAGFSLVTLALLAVGEPDAPGSESGLDGRVRAMLVTLAVALGLLALALWIDPGAVAGGGPFDLPPLGGRFAGSWVALLAVLAGWAAWQDSREEAAIAAIALVALPVGALVAALPVLDELAPTGAAVAYLGGLALLVAAGLLVAGSTGRPEPDPSRLADVGARG